MALQTPASTQGETLKFGQQDDLVTVSDFAGDNDGDIRVKDAVTFPTDSVQVAQQSNRGNAVFSDKSDKPITYEMVRENAITVPLVARKALTEASDQPPLITMLESGGCNISMPYNHASTTSSTATNSFTITDDMAAGADRYNQAAMIELDTGVYYPTLINKLTDGAGGTALLWMDLPSAQTSGNNVIPMWTATPRATSVDASKLLTFYHNTRGTGAGGSETLTFGAKGCALGSIGGISIEPEGNGDLVWSPTFHAADVMLVNEALGAESFVGVEKYLRSGGNFRFEFGDYTASGDIASSYKELIKADIDFGLTTVPATAGGSTSILNGIQGYVSVYQTATVTLQVIMKYADFTDVIDGTFTSQYMGFVWPTSSKPSDPGGLGIWFPNCYQTLNPTWDGSGNYGVATLTYSATAAACTGGGTANNSPAMAPWAIAINGKTTAAA